MELHKLLKHLQEENKALKETTEDQELIINAFKLENEMMKARLAKLGDMTIRQELRARFICAMLSSAKGELISNAMIDGFVNLTLPHDNEGAENADDS